MYDIEGFQRGYVYPSFLEYLLFFDVIAELLVVDFLECADFFKFFKRFVNSFL